MTIARRPLLAGLALAMLGGPVFAKGATVEEITEPYGMIGKIKAVPGKRAELLAILNAGTAGMPGCLAYIVAEDVKDPDGIWITEFWSDKAHHDDSLKLPEVREAIARGRPMIAGFEMSVEVRPIRPPLG